MKMIIITNNRSTYPWSLKASSRSSISSIQSLSADGFHDTHLSLSWSSSSAQLLVQLPHPAHNSILKLNSSWPSSHLQPILPSIFLAVWPDPRQYAQTAQQSSSVESESMARLLVEEVMPLFGSSFLLPFLGFCMTHPVSY